MSAEPRPPCPCCGQEWPLGLFARNFRVQLPFPIRMMTEASHFALGALVDEDEIIFANGRAFICCWSSLPLSWLKSPIQVRVWLECDVRYARKLSLIQAGEGKGFFANGTLACNLPGFPGSLGASVSFSADPAERRARLRVVEDARVHNLPQHPSHEQMAALYRACFGNFTPLDDADPAWRMAIVEGWRSLIDRPTYREPVEPPAALAGMRPAELIVSPPHDTGEEVMAATVGASDVVTENGKRAELVTWARDAGEPFMRSFGEFCYLSRLAGLSPEHGSYIPESSRPIPGTDQMAGWLICEPSWVRPEWDRPAEFDVLDHQVQVFAAVPVKLAEQEFARARGVGRLMDELERHEVDFTDLRREAIPLP